MQNRYICISHFCICYSLVYVILYMYIVCSMVFDGLRLLSCYHTCTCVSSINLQYYIYTCIHRKYFLFSFQLPREIKKKGTDCKGHAQYHLPTFNTTVKSTSLPLAYKPEDKRKPNTPSISPKHNKVCDYDGCDIQGGENVKRMVCGHTYHTEC